jgi:hypothetical protein
MRYRFFDFAIESDVPFEGLPQSLDPPRLTLSRAVDPECSRGAEWFHAFVRSDATVWLRVGRTNGDLVMDFCGSAFLHVASDVVWWHREPHTGKAAFRHLLLDQALPLVAANAGRVVLHAACLALDERAVLLAGPSGAGKSTLAAAIARVPGVQVSDDTTALSVRDDSVIAQPAYSGVRLWPDAMAALTMSGGEAVWEGSEKRHLRADDGSEPRAVACIYELERTDYPRLRIVDLRGRDALMALVRNALVLDPYDRARSVALLSQLSAVATRVRMCRVEVPKRFEVLADVVSLLHPAGGSERAL